MGWRAVEPISAVQLFQTLWDDLFDAYEVKEFKEIVGSIGFNIPTAER